MEYAEPVLVYDRIDANRRNTVLLLVLFGVLLVPLFLYFILLAALLSLALGALLGEWAEALIRPGGLGVAALTAYAEYRYGPEVLLRIAGARPVRGNAEPELRRTLQNLCIGGGLAQPRLYIVESPAPNAFAVGLDPEHASLAVTRGLLDLMDRRELEGVIAHELSHIGNIDTRLSTVAAVGAGTLRLPVMALARVFRITSRIHWLAGATCLVLLTVALLAGSIAALALVRNDPDVGLILLFGVALPSYLLVVAPLLGALVRLALSRQQELLADADAVLLARYPEALARALAKTGAAGGTQTNVSGATAHLYFVDPLSRDAPWWDRIFSTHPAVEERIALLAGMGGGITPSVLRAAEEAGAKFQPADTATASVATAYRERGRLRGEVTAPDKVRRDPVAIRLTGAGTTLYERPDTASTQLAQLPGGALITVLGKEVGFLRVRTADDSFGYIPRSAAMTEVDLDDPAAV